MYGVAVPVGQTSIHCQLGSTPVALTAQMRIQAGGKATVELRNQTSPGNCLASTDPLDYPCAWRVMQCVKHLTDLHDYTLQGLVGFIDGSRHDNDMSMLTLIAYDLDWFTDDLVAAVRTLAQSWPSADELRQTLVRLPKPLQDELLLELRQSAAKGMIADREILAFLESFVQERRSEETQQVSEVVVQHAHKKPGFIWRRRR